MISEFIAGGCIVPWFLFLLLILGKCDDCAACFPACSLSVLTGCLLVLEAGHWGELEEKVLVKCWGWGQRGEGDHCRFLAAELVMRLGGLDFRSLQPTCCPGRSGFWVAGVPCWHWG